MDNLKTGLFIKELRKEKGMTQKELADMLHITDRAVSKWERGLCAPDLSTLEPLAKILGVTVTEIIAGQRIDTGIKEIEENVQGVIAYSQNELISKASLLRKKYLMLIGISIASVIAVCLIFMWWQGYFNIVSRASSPNGEIHLTIYNRDITQQRFSSQSAITIQSAGAEVSTAVYRGCFQGIFWSPDSSKYVLSCYDTDRTTLLVLNNLEDSISSDLNAYLSFGVEANELAKYGLQYSDQSPRPKVDYQFLQWSADSKSILVYYSFHDTGEKLHKGYFWYNCEAGSINSILEL